MERWTAGAAADARPRCRGRLVAARSDCPCRRARAQPPHKDKGDWAKKGGHSEMPAVLRLIVLRRALHQRTSRREGWWRKPPDRPPPSSPSPRALATPAQCAHRGLRYPPGCAAMARAPRRQRAARHRRQHRARCSNTSEPDPAVQQSVRSQKSVQVTKMAGHCRQRDSNTRMPGARSCVLTDRPTRRRGRPRALN